MILGCSDRENIFISNVTSTCLTLTPAHTPRPRPALRWLSLALAAICQTLCFYLLCWCPGGRDICLCLFPWPSAPSTACRRRVVFVVWGRA